MQIYLRTRIGQISVENQKKVRFGKTVTVGRCQFKGETTGEMIPLQTALHGKKDGNKILFA
jgi:hypothetical protein